MELCESQDACKGLQLCLRVPGHQEALPESARTLHADKAYLAAAV